MSLKKTINGLQGVLRQRNGEEVNYINVMYTYLKFSKFRKQFVKVTQRF